MVGYTEGDNPVDEGKYVVWVNPDFDIPYAAQKFMMWMDGKWWLLGSDCQYRDVVYGFAGPLPSLKLTGETK